MKQISIDNNKNLKFPDLFDKGNRHLLKAEIEKVLNSKTVKDSRKTNPITRRECHKITPITSRKCDSLSVKVYTLQRYLTLFNLRDFFLIKALEAKECIKISVSSKTWDQIVENFKKNYPSFANSIVNNTKDFAKEYIPAFLDFLDSVKNNRIYLDDIKQSANLIHKTINQYLGDFKKFCLESESKKSVFIASCFCEFFNSSSLFPAKFEISDFDYNRLILILTDIAKCLVIPMMNDKVFDQEKINFLQVYLNTLLFLHQSQRKIFNEVYFSKFFLSGGVDRVVIACRDRQKELPDKISKILSNGLILHHYLPLLRIFNIWRDISTDIECFFKKCDSGEEGILCFEEDYNPYINIIFHEFVILADDYLEKKYLHIFASKKTEVKKLEEEVSVLIKFLKIFYLFLKTLTIKVTIDKYSSIDFLVKTKKRVEKLIASVKKDSPGYSSLEILYLTYKIVVKIFEVQKITDFEDTDNLLTLDLEIMLTLDDHHPLFSIFEKTSL